MNCGLMSFPGSNVPGLASVGYAIWRARVAGRGGFTTSTEEIAARLYARMSERSYLAKLVYFLPFLGASIEGACVPLVDAYGAGPVTAVAFAEADYSEGAGIQGNGSTKILISTLRPMDLNGNLGGLGWWELAFTGSGNSEPIGYGDASPDNRFTLDLRSNRRFFCWGAVSASESLCDQDIAASSGHWYGQKSAAAARLLALNGGVLLENTTSESTSQANTGAGRTFVFCGANYDGTYYPWPGRGGCAYLTMGTLTASELAELHADILEYLMVPTGRV